MVQKTVSDSVYTAFQLMLEELEGKADDLNSEGAAFFRNSDYESAKLKADHGDQLRRFRAKVEILRDEWIQSHSTTFPVTEASELDAIVRTISTGSKSRKTALVVKFPDGHTIYEKVASDTFAKSLEKIGLEKVERLGIMVNKLPLISRQAPKTYQCTEVRGLYIITHSSTDYKRQLLERVSNELNIGLSVNIVPT